MNIFLIGDVRSAYRVEYFIRTCISDRKYNIFVNDLQVTGGHNKFVKKLISLLALRNADVVFVAPCQHNSALVKVAVKMKKSIITDFYISFYDTEVFDRKNCTIDSKIAKKWKKVDLFAMQNSSLLLFLNQSEAHYYFQALGMNPQTVNYKIVPLCIPDKPKAELPYFRHKTDYIHFCWCGTYIPLQGIEKIIQAAAIALKKGLRMKLTFWGDSNEKAKPYTEMIHALGIEEQVSVQNDNWGDMQAWIEFITTSCDVSLGIFGDSNKAKTVLANKVMDGIAFRTPMLTGESSGAREYFNDSQIFFVEATPEQIAEKMIAISQMSAEKIDGMVERAYQVYQENFTPECFAKNIKECFNSIQTKKK